MAQRGAEPRAALEAATGKSVEVIDLRTLAPYDFEAIKKSISKTSRLMIAHEEHKTSGFAGEITARVNEDCFANNHAPILWKQAFNKFCCIKRQY